MWRKLIFCVCLIKLVSCQNLHNEGDRCNTPDQKVGNCFRVHDCRPMLDFFKNTPKPYPPHIANAIKGYRCNSRGNFLLVCCPDSPIIITDTQDTQNDVPPPDVTNHPKLNLLPLECGKSGSEDKISGGQDADLLEFPWMALISYKTGSGPKFKCGGSIINNRYILTAAHCITHLSESLLGVRIGEHDIRKNIDCQNQLDKTMKCTKPVQDLRIEKVIVHPNYDARNFINDIGLLRLQPMDLTAENAKPICLPTDEKTRLSKYNNVIVTGWGIDSSGRIKTTLQKVELPISQLDECQEAYSSDRRVKITSKHVCAGGKMKKVSCPGDSGGPLQVHQFINDDIRVVQQGIVSFGHQECGIEGFPGVYTKVAHFMDWILDSIEP